MKKLKFRHLPPIFVSVIPHKRQSYDTAGNYTRHRGNMYFDISQMTPDAELMVLVHELVEWFLITKKGIKISDIDKFDKASTWDDPGCDPKAPYHAEHIFCIKVEKMICKKLGLDWKTYDSSFSQLRWRNE